MSSTGAMRRVRGSESSRKIPAKWNYRKYAYRYGQERDTVLILVLFLLLIIFLLYFS